MGAGRHARVNHHPKTASPPASPLSLRPTTRLARVGSDQLTITELIAIVLNTTDALDLAQEIVCEFAIENLSQTTLTELQQLRGIGPSRAGQLLAAIELGRRLVNYRTDHPQITIVQRSRKSPRDAAEILMPKLKHEQQEHFIVIPVNMKNRMLLDIVWLYKGTLNSSVLRNGEVYREAIRRQAAAIIVAHNHPSGDPTPSPEDVRVTSSLRKAGELLDIELLDHLIIGDGRFVSMKEKGFGF